jgi:alpha-beta hydrolase superfamily lysophospholipase
MVKKEEFYYDSSDKITKIHGIKWIPDGEVKGILQISHGMLEHMDRYHEFASYIADKGILVAGNDHLGHGYSLMNEEDRGYFSKDNGNKTVIEDMHKLSQILKAEYKGVPYFILGHSMGSFLLRQYITIYSEKLDGAIIMGTGNQPYALLKAGIIITRLIALFKGWRYRSSFVDKLALGNNNNKFEPARTRADWLSKDNNKVDEYIADKRINFVFTLNAYYNMFKGMEGLYKESNLQNMDKELPVIFMSGAKDPVGNFSKDVKKVYEEFKAIGMKKLDIKIYDDDRHEILNENDRETVYVDIEKWILRRI